MYICLVLLLFFQADSLPSGEPERQIYDYVQQIENGDSVSESLWSLSQIYLENRDYRQTFYEIGHSQDVEWIDLFDLHPSDQFRLNPAALHELALYFGDEHLLLYLLLQVESDENRRTYFEEFYSATPNGRLKDLNRRIAERTEVHAEDLLQDRWDFSTFLILFYPNNVDIEGAQFYKEAARGLEEMIRQHAVANPLQSNFLYASLFEAFNQLGNYGSIIPYYQQLIDLGHLPDVFWKRNLYWHLDVALYRTGYIDRSLEVQRKQTIRLSRMTGDESSLNTILTNHGGYLYTIGRYGEAKEVFTSLLADTTDLSPTIHSRVLNNLSLVHYKLGETDRYLETQIKSLNLAVESGDYSDQLNIYRNLHIYHRNNQNRDLAATYIEKAQNIAKKIENKNELASVLISKADYYDRFLNDIDGAFALLSDAQLLLEDSDNDRLRARILSEKATLHKKRGEYIESRDLFSKVISISSKNDNNRGILQALVHLAEVELMMGKSEAAQKTINTFNSYDLSVVDFHVLVNARRIEAEIAWTEGRIQDAEALIAGMYQQVMERGRNTANREAGYWHVEESYLHLVRLYAELLEEQNRPDEMVNVLDQLKTINDAALVKNPLVTSGLLSEEELTENLRITQELDNLRKRLMVADEKEKLSLQSKISALTARKNQLLQQKPSSELLRTLPLSDIQSRLRKGEGILHITRIQDNLYMVLIDRHEITTKKLLFTESEEVLFEEALDGLATGATDLEALHKVYSWLELDKLPEQWSSLIVVPDSYLYQLPVGVLPVSPPSSPLSYGSAEYLVEQMDIRYLNSLKDLFRPESEQNYTFDFTGIGVSDFDHAADKQLLSLPNASQEVHTIAERLNSVGKTRAFLNSEATPHAFRSGVSDSRILHVASHSKISEDNPLFSTIYLHPGMNEESGDSLSGQIFAYQLFNMDLDNELIMLNSCESASGEYVQGAGIMGISRTLRYAGAQSLVLNLWQVEDQLASDFAIDFYEGLSEGKTKPAALREAKMDFLKNKNANPHYWGAYMLNGNPQPVVDNLFTPPVLAFIVLLMGGLVFMGVWLLRRNEGIDISFPVLLRSVRSLKEFK
ncbi:CHAT domain-containing protein [Fodinibius sediminis]|uniref:CHAT domain-containing protein n=1 Tax=Fodinibius sediminis TaxID=1214077 RepID=A0A521DBA4_9BACT|nr:CHAT domain-containing tetratricopeptide repeat protein [Fodinibius sediminis]SMO68999.1 CHAT domain-containing protein [Fodinibius sediminis]